MARKTISNSFTVTTVVDGKDGVDGTSPYSTDLTNEMDAIACDNKGVPYLVGGVPPKVGTVLRIYHGSSLVWPLSITVNDESGTGYTNNVEQNGITVSWTTTGTNHRSFYIQFSPTYTVDGNERTLTLPEKKRFAITASVLGQAGAQTLLTTTFVVNCIRGTALYKLVPSVSEIVKHTDGTCTPETNITCDVVKQVGGVTSTPSNSEYRLRYSIDTDDYEHASAFPYTTGIDPSGVTSNLYIYLNVGGIMFDKETISVVVDGQSVSTLDIDNEYDGVPTDSTGKILAAKTVQTIVRLYKGSTEISISGVSVNTTGGISVTGMPTSTVATFTPSAEGGDGKGKKLSWAFNANETMSDKYNVAISYTYRGTEYKATFTINASKGQAVFNLKPSYSALPCTRNASTGALNNPPALSLQVEVNDTNKPTILSSFDNNGAVTYNNTKYYVRYSKSSMPTSGNLGTAWPSENSLQALTSDNNIYIAIFTTNTPSGTLLDRETIPLVKDGEDGEDAHEVNPNILLDTAEYKTGVYNSSTNPNGKWYKLNGVNSGNYEGRVARYVDTSNTTREGSPSYYRRVAEQQVAYTSSSNNKLSANTWYTLSAYFKGSGTGALLMLQATGYFDSVFYRDGNSDTYTSGDLVYQFSLSSTWTRHTLTFKTKSSMSSSKILYASTRLINDTGNVYVAMMKLEQGDTATAYLPNEADLEGANAPYIQVSPTNFLYQADKNGYVSGDQQTTLYYSLKVNGGTCSVSASGVSITLPTTDTTIISNDTIYSGSCVIYVYGGKNPTGNITLTMTGTYNGKTYTATTYIPVAGVRAGVDGSRGRIGRGFYYGGEFDSSDTTQTFLVNNAQAPYFSHGINAASGLPNCHVYNPSGDVNTSLTMSQMWDNSSSSWNNAPWEDFNSQYKYLMSQVIFSDSGYFGAAIINKDWIYSKHGTLYLAFDENISITKTSSTLTEGTFISVFYPKESGYHTIRINYTTNGGTLNYRLVRRQNVSNTQVFGATQTSGTWAEHKAYLYANADYVLEASKPSSAANTPIINSVTMESESGNNYIFFDPYTTWGRKNVFATYEDKVYSSGTVVANNLNLSSGLQYRFFVEYKGAGLSYFKLEIQTTGGSWETIQTATLSGWTSSTDYTERSANIGIGSGYGGSSYKGIYRITLYNSSSSTDTYVRNLSITSGQMFAPNWGVDLLTGVSSSNRVCVRGSVYAESGVFNGTVYAKDGVFNGEVHAESGSFNGTVNARLFSAATLIVPSRLYTIDLETNPYYTYYAQNNSTAGTGTITLPSPSTYNGVELRFFSAFLTRSSAGTNIYYSGGIKTIKNDGMLGTYQTLKLKDNRFATVKAMNNAWYVVDGGVEVPDASAPEFDPELLEDFEE